MIYWERRVGRLSNTRMVGRLSLQVVSYSTQARNLGWPSMGLHFNPSANASYYLDVPLTAAADNSGKFNVYTPETMPERVPLRTQRPNRANLCRSEPGLCVDDAQREGDVGLSKGVCGPFMPWPCPHSLCDFSRTTGMTITNLLCAPYLWHMVLFSTDAKAMHHRQGHILRPRVGLWMPTRG